MNVKLTLRMNREVIEFAKAYSRKTGQSISGLVASYFQGIKALDGGKGQKRAGNALHPIVRSLRGSLKGAKADRDDYIRYLEEKYK